MSDNKTHESKNKGINPIAAIIGGAIVGAGVAVAGAVLLKDEKKRQKVTDVLFRLKDHAGEIIDNVQKHTQGQKTEIDKKLAKK